MDPTNPYSASNQDPPLSKVVNDADHKAPVGMDVGAILTRAYELARDNLGIVVGTILIAAAPGIANGIVGAILQLSVQESDNEGAILAVAIVRLVLNIAAIVVGIYLQLGAVRVFTRLVRGMDTEFAMVFGEGGLLLPALGAFILVGLAVGLGLILLIVPGIIIGLGLQFYLYAMVDKNLGPIEAMKESWRLTDGYKLQVFFVNLVIALIGIAVTCATCGIGYILIVPILALTQAVMYHSLLHLKGGSQ